MCRDVLSGRVCDRAGDRRRSAFASRIAIIGWEVQASQQRFPVVAVGVVGQLDDVRHRIPVVVHCIPVFVRGLQRLSPSIAAAASSGLTLWPSMEFEACTLRANAVRRNGPYHRRWFTQQEAEPLTRLIDRAAELTDA